MIFRSMVLTALVSLSCISSVCADTLVYGHWDGAVERMGSSQPISFDFRHTAAGELNATFDIPEMGIFAQPVDSVTLNGNTLTIHFLYGTFTATVHSQNAEITGANPNWKPQVNLDLKRALKVATFTETPIVVRNGEVRIAGTLYRPLLATRVPLVVMVPGSSNAGRSSFEYRGYGPMLAQQGVAAFVYDKRDVGASSHVAPPPTFADYASDANAAVNQLRKYPGIDPHRVGISGASQGGWIAPLAAAGNRNIAFLILLSGPAVSVERQEIDRVGAAMNERAASAEETQRAMAFTRAYFDVATGKAPLSTLQSQYDQLLANKPSWIDVVSVPDPGESLQGAVNDWKRILYDPAATLKATRIPILALFGERDDEVLTQDNEPLMRSLISRNNVHNEIVVMKGANHALFMGQSLFGGDWQWPEKYWLWDRRAPDLMPTIVHWIKALPPKGLRESRERAFFRALRARPSTSSGSFDGLTMTGDLG